MIVLYLWHLLFPFFEKLNHVWILTSSGTELHVCLAHIGTYNTKVDKNDCYRWSEKNAKESIEMLFYPLSKETYVVEWSSYMEWSFCKLLKLNKVCIIISWTFEQWTHEIWSLLMIMDAMNHLDWMLLTSSQIWWHWNRYWSIWRKSTCSQVPQSLENP